MESKRLIYLTSQVLVNYEVKCLNARCHFIRAMAGGILRCWCHFWIGKMDGKNIWNKYSVTLSDYDYLIDDKH